MHSRRFTKNQKMDEAKIQLFDQIKNLLSLNMRGMLIPSTLYDAVHRN